MEKDFPSPDELVRLMKAQQLEGASGWARVLIGYINTGQLTKEDAIPYVEALEQAAGDAAKDFRKKYNQLLEKTSENS